MKIKLLKTNCLNGVFQLVSSLFLSSLFYSSLFSQDGLIKIHLRGVYSSKISVIPLSGMGALKPILELDSVKNGEVAQLKVPAHALPGEFVLRFDYKEKANSTPYPSEKYVIITSQKFELWVNPPYCNNQDSTYFQKGEKENAVYLNFSKQNAAKKEKIGLLQNFVMNYDAKESVLFQQAVQEYTSRRTDYNHWIAEQANLYRSNFASHTFMFQALPGYDLIGTEEQRYESMLLHYFDEINFKDSLILSTKEFRDFVNGYVNLYGSKAFTEAMRDSLFTLAGSRAIEKASMGSPKVYGWMVDYFYLGYETYHISPGMVMLEKHIAQPNCLTSKKQEILKRLNSMDKLKVGTKAPNFQIKESDQLQFELSTYQTSKPYILVLFWSADCNHCQQLINDLYPWFKTGDNQRKVDVLAVSLDETTTEITTWTSAIIRLPEWNHMRTPEGIRSKAANDYGILSTPSMFLLDSKTQTIQLLPQQVSDLSTFFEKK